MYKNEKIGHPINRHKENERQASEKGRRNSVEVSERVKGMNESTEKPK